MFTHRLRAAYRDVTAGNHVYYARYLDWLEIARNEAFRELGFPLIALQEQGVILPVIESAMKHLGFARYDDEVEIRTRVVELGGASFLLEYRIFRGSDLLLEATTRHAVANLTEKPVRMPPALKERLARHLASASE